jgi:hypothetical protein
VAEIKIETDIDRYITLEALPNLPVLGPKFKGNKAFKDIRTSIVNLSP